MLQHFHELYGNNISPLHFTTETDGILYMYCNIIMNYSSYMLILAIYLYSVLGLRMSHFSEGGEGVAADPKQKTLSNFLVAEDASRRGLGAQAQSESTTSDDAVAIGRESSLFSDMHKPSESIDFEDTYQIRDSEHTGTRQFLNEAETQGTLDLYIENSNEKVRILTPVLV